MAAAPFHGTAEGTVPVCSFPGASFPAPGVIQPVGDKQLSGTTHIPNTWWTPVFKSPPCRKGKAASATVSLKAAQTGPLLRSWDQQPFLEYGAKPFPCTFFVICREWGRLFSCLAERVALVLLCSLAKAKRALSIHNSTWAVGLLKKKVFLNHSFWICCIWHRSAKHEWNEWERIKSFDFLWLVMNVGGDGNSGLIVSLFFFPSLFFPLSFFLSSHNWTSC